MRGAGSRRNAPGAVAIMIATAAIVLAIGGFAAEAAAQPASRNSGGEWRVAQDDFVNRWFGALATIGDGGNGILPLYERSYASRARANPNDPLVARAAQWRTAFAHDRELEIRHFVPLYFVGVKPDVALSALRCALTNASPAPQMCDVAAQARAVVAPMRSAWVRAKLFDLVNDMERSWQGATLAAADPLDDAVVSRLDAQWDSAFAPALSTYLREVKRERGTILIVRALGAEGRVATGVGGRAIIAVAAGPGDAPLLAAVRELSYAMLDRVELPRDEGPVTARARARERASVRAGALLLDALLPSAAPRYRAQFAAALGAPAADFDRVYPIDARTQRALSEFVKPLTTSVLAEVP